MGNQAIIAVVVLVATGALIAMQAPINAALGRGVGSAVGAATISFGVGFVLLLGITLVMGDGASLLRINAVPIWMLVGGTMGAAFVFAALWAVPIVGVLTMSTLIILGQMVAAMVLDQTGAFGLAQISLTPTRLMAAGLVAAGVVLSRF
ncbi:DMT family transporter [Rhodobacteraceae bacterium KMM 6894]|nr:DMT family transporter [Rhodobacteraceae bacterium KMM 6894]